MELCERRTLDDLLYSLGSHDPKFLIDLYSQVIQGIKFLRSKTILHRDIKPSNLLVTKNNVVKIADFGSSRVKHNNSLMLTTLVGTLLFDSPEVLRIKIGTDDDKEKAYTEKSEIWALGLILYYMFNYEYSIQDPVARVKSSLPWAVSGESGLLENILSQPLKFKKEDRIPEEIK
jgi:serine/threonine protein kinase